MVDVQKKLEKLGHEVLMPNKTEGVDYWAKDNKSRVEAKRKFRFIDLHIEKIKRSDAILVVNITKNDIVNYIGANTFLEMGFAYYWKKKIFILNPLPDQTYIIDELLTFEPIVLNGHLEDVSGVEGVK